MPGDLEPRHTALQASKKRKPLSQGTESNEAHGHKQKRGSHQSYPHLKHKAQALLSRRQKLPIWGQRKAICQALQFTDVMILVGETGSGKSTQVPQFLLDESWCKQSQLGGASGHENSKPNQVGGCIAVTEPRRVAAITLARRVAEEMGTPLGSSSPVSRVGYSVRFDNSTSASTKVKFLTEGMLLQEMLRDPWLRHYSAIIVDEVHERSVNVDLILGFMRLLLNNKDGRGGVPLKVVVMSATADTEGLLRFFYQDRAEPHQPREGSKTIANSTASELERNGCLENKESRDITENTIFNQQNSHGSSRVSTVHIKGRQFPIDVIYAPETVQDSVSSVLSTVFQIHHKEPLPGDILVFLEGQEMIESLEKLINDYAVGLGSELPRLLVLPLFAALPQPLQQRVFEPTLPKTRRVILSTNIAETSVTVPGVRYVIDNGKSKIKQFRANIGLDSLLIKSISKSAANQRKGRAGREAPGKCYRLYTEKEYYSLEDSQTPEVLRCDLAQAILNMKARGVDDIWKFPFLDPPNPKFLLAALEQLLQLGALEGGGEVSNLGSKIARLPVSVPLARVLVGAMEEESDCLAKVIDIVSCLSVENIFLNLTSEMAKEEAETARGALYRREGDHLTLLAAVHAYMKENSDRKRWAEKHFVSHRAMQAVMVSCFVLEAMQ